MSDPDIKALLGRAVEDEPPLTIDRAEVFRRGRRKLRNRRFTEVGGVAAGVVVAVVGAVVLIGVTGQDPDRLTPATPSTTSSGPPNVTGTSEYPPQYEETGGHAATLTDAFRTAGLLPAGVDVDPKPGKPAHPYFIKAMGTYHLDVDLVGDDGAGALSVEVSPVPVGTTVTCDDLKPSAEASCSANRIDGTDVVLVEETSSDGRRSISTVAVHQDGTKVTAYVSNAKSGVFKPEGDPPLSTDQLARIVTAPELVWG